MLSSLDIPGGTSGSLCTGLSPPALSSPSFSQDPWEILAGTLGTQAVSPRSGARGHSELTQDHQGLALSLHIPVPSAPAWSFPELSLLVQAWAFPPPT